MPKTYGLKIGNGFIRDLLNPKTEELDISAIRGRLMTMKRFSGNPEALTVQQHVVLVGIVANILGQHPREWGREVRFWCHHHDMHEGIIGDIPGPLKTLIGEHSSILDVIEEGLDAAICEKLGMTPPSPMIRAIVHEYDKIAETIEWVYVLGETPEPWNKPIPKQLDEQWCRDIIKTVRTA